MNQKHSSRQTRAEARRPSPSLLWNSFGLLLTWGIRWKSNEYDMVRNIDDKGAVFYFQYEHPVTFVWKGILNNISLLWRMKNWGFYNKLLETQNEISGEDETEVMTSMAISELRSPSKVCLFYQTTIFHWSPGVMYLGWSLIRGLCCR